MGSISEIALELERLASEIESINTRPINERIDILALTTSRHATDATGENSDVMEFLHS